jgi:hypothetical protein
MDCRFRRYSPSCGTKKQFFYLLGMESCLKRLVLVAGETVSGPGKGLLRADGPLEKKLCLVGTELVCSFENREIEKFIPGRVYNAAVTSPIEV